MLTEHLTATALVSLLLFIAFDQTANRRVVPFTVVIVRIFRCEFCRTCAGRCYGMNGVPIVMISQTISTRALI
jgi:hypothetical protein